jgi:hypothetical protein
MFMAQIREMHCQQNMDNMFLYFTAPILRGAKPASLFTLNPHCLSFWHERQNALRKATGLRTLEIVNQRGAVLLFSYDESALRVLLQDIRAMALLARYGYPAGRDPREMLRYLRRRFSNSGFPHEIGVFLGYPADDVWSFIANGGKNYICCLYWKVYHNVERAREIFNRIDEAQRYAVDLLSSPIPIHTAINMFKAG